MIRRLDLHTIAPFALASGANGVWVATRDRLRLHDAFTGAPIDDAERGEITWAGEQRGDAGPTVVVVSEDRIAACVGDDLLVVDRRDDSRARRVPTPTTPDVLVIGRGSVWAGTLGRNWIVEVDAAGSSTMRHLDAPLAGLAADEHGPWWIEVGSDLLVNDDRTVRLPTVGGPGMGMVASGGAVWVSVEGGLVLVRPFSAELGPTVPISFGPVARLVDVSGVLVGGDRFDAVFVMDPARDVGPRSVDLGRSGEISSIGGSSGVVWIAAADGDTISLEI